MKEQDRIAQKQQSKKKKLEEKDRKKEEKLIKDVVKKPIPERINPSKQITEIYPVG